jgi:ribosome-binding protein aMBF1 (putative translation factor)
MTMGEHSRLVPGEYLDDPEVRAGYEDAKRALAIGAMVRELRLEAGLSQAELARRSGMTQPALSRLEHGGGLPTIAVLDRIADALHVTLNVSFTRSAA